MKNLIKKIKEILNTPKKQLLAGFLAILLTTSLITGAYYFKLNPPKKKDKPIVEKDDEPQEKDDEQEDFREDESADIDEKVEDNIEDSNIDNNVIESDFTEEIVNGEREVVKFEEEIIEDPELPIGESYIKVPGLDGERLYKDRVYYENGVEYKRDKNISNELTKEPINQIKIIGTQEIEEPSDDL